MFKSHNLKNPNNYRQNSSKGYGKKKRPFSKITNNINALYNAPTNKINNFSSTKNKFYPLNYKLDSMNKYIDEDQQNYNFNSEFSNNKDIFIKQINSDNGRKLDYIFKSNAKKSKSQKKQYKPNENNFYFKPKEDEENYYASNQNIKMNDLMNIKKNNNYDNEFIELKKGKKADENLKKENFYLKQRNKELEKEIKEKENINIKNKELINAYNEEYRNINQENIALKEKIAILEEEIAQLKNNYNFYKELKLVGLDNNGETHFMNSNLQCLSQTKPLNNNNISSNENFIENNFDISKNIQKKENQIKNNSNFNKEAQEKDKNEKKNIKNKDKNLEIDAHIEMVNKMEESYIDKIYELSNNRIAVIKIVNDFPVEEVLKIYSLNNFKLLSEIKFKEKTKNIVELKNKDLVRSFKTISYKERNSNWRIFSSFEFYKLYNQKYELFQKIEEETIDINYILGLMDGNLVSFNTYGIEIYSKEKDKYKSISKIKMEDTAMSGYEIEQNKLIIFKKSSEPKELQISILNKSNYSPHFVISFFDLLNKKEKILISKENLYNYKFFNFLKNDKYLFVIFQITKSYMEHWEPDPNYKFGTLNRTLNHCDIEYLNVGYVYNLSKEKFLECELEIPPIDKRIAILWKFPL